jgi:uncharacterized membrane protein
MAMDNPVGAREAAIASLRRKSEFRKHLLTYVLVNLGLVVIWFFTTRGQFFWPIFPILGWGVGLAFHAYDVYSRGPSEERIQQEMRRQGRT